MPPRWLLIAVIAIYSTSWIKSVIAVDPLNTLPVASNGWRPIVGSSPVKPYITIDQNQKQTISLTSNNHNHNQQQQEHNNKHKPEHKNKNNNNNNNNKSNLVHISHHGSTGHHVLKPKPLAPPAVVKGGSKPAPRHPVLGKLQAHMAHAKRHKSTARPPPRDEIMAPAPSSAIGSYAYFNQGPLSLQSSKPFQGHVDFSNHFAFSNINNDVILPQQQQQQQQQRYPAYQQPPKHPSQNDVHNFVYINQHDDFTRNLVPPPPVYKPQGEKETVLVREQGKYAEQSQVVKHQDVVPDNLILQLNQYQYQHPQFDLEITKEKFKEYHTTLAPINYKTTESYPEPTKYNKPQLFTKPHLYEVTEDKEWAEHLPAYKKYPQQTYQFQYPDETLSTQFLPTPYNPDHAFPTSPTQAEVSTIYSEVTNKKKTALKVPTTTSYNIKEVATHFPLFSENKTPQIEIPDDKVEEYTTQEVTRRPTEETTQPTEPATHPTRASTPSQRRPTHRRRRPTKPTTTPETILQTEPVQEEDYETTTKLHRRRRPIKYRTTETPISSTRGSYRVRPTRPEPQTITEEVYVNKNHRYRPYQTFNQEDRTEQQQEEDVSTISNKNHRYRPYQTLNQEDRTDLQQQQQQQQQEEEDVSTIANKNHRYKPYQIMNQEDRTELDQQQQQQQEEEVVSTIANKNLRYRPYQTMTQEDRTEQQDVSTSKPKRKRLRPVSTTTEPLPSTSLNMPENELDYTTTPLEESEPEESATVREVYDFEPEYSTSLTTIPASTSSTTPSTTTTTTSTTTEARTTRTRQRPIKYDVQRPRFSVKDYRQRLNQYMSSTTESTKTENSSPKIRFPNRFKQSTTTASTEESTEPIRQKYIPKDSRRKYTTEASEGSSTEKYLRTMSPRFKQYRYRSSTEPTTSTTTQRVSIKPNIFTNLKRPQQLSLRNRIYNKKRNGTTTTTTQPSEEPETVEPITENIESEVTIPFEIAESKIEVTTQLYDYKSESTTTEKASDDSEAFLQLQRIQDLTSSAHKQYNTPGMFKSVSPTSRRVPSYFTIATEDPILPIEAFFPNLNQKGNDRL